MKHLYYILIGQRVEPCNLRTWARWFEAAPRMCRRVADDTMDSGIRVSTVFLGVDHNFGSVGPPLLFETMVFGIDGLPLEGIGIWRYATWHEAAAGHASVLQIARVYADRMPAEAADALARAATKGERA